MNPPKISIEVVSLEKTSTFRERKRVGALRESSNSPLSHEDVSDNGDAMSSNSIRDSPRIVKVEIPAKRDRHLEIISKSTSKDNNKLEIRGLGASG